MKSMQEHDALRECLSCSDHYNPEHAHPHNKLNASLHKVSETNFRIPQYISEFQVALIMSTWVVHLFLSFARCLGQAVIRW